MPALLRSLAQVLLLALVLVPILVLLRNSGNSNSSQTHLDLGSKRIQQLPDMEKPTNNASTTTGSHYENPFQRLRDNGARRAPGINVVSVQLHI